MNILIRTDFEIAIGSGHLTRCLAICELLKTKVNTFTIATTTPPNPLYKNISDAGYKILEIPKGLSETDDAKFCLQWLKTQTSNWIVIVDHYGLGKKWEEQFYKQHKLLVIDDMLREHICHGLLDSNYRVNYDILYKDKVPESCTLLLGPQNFPLRTEFIEEKNNPSPRKEGQVMVCFGGTDPTGETLKFLEQARVNKLTYKIALPSSHGQFEKIRSFHSKKNMEIVVNPPIAKLMAESEFYLGSCGIITWERLYMGLPGLVVTVAGNQIENARSLEHQKVHSYFGHWDKISYVNVEEKILSVFTHEEKRLMRRTAEDIVHPLNPVKLDFLFN